MKKFQNYIALLIDNEFSAQEIHLNKLIFIPISEY